MRNLYELYKVDKLKKWDKYTSMFRVESKIDIINLIPLHFREKYLKDLESAKLIVKQKDESLNYIDRYKKNQLVFNSIEKAKINSLAYKVVKDFEKNETILSNLASFKPEGGFSSVSQYNQTKTISGRLTDANGSPKILTLPSRCRKIFDSRWGNEGCLIILDFKNLEPRVIRKINGKNSGDDIYKEIADTLDFEVDRVVIKRGIISTLYGLNTQIEGLSKDRSEAVLEATKSYFDLSLTLEKAEIVNDIGCRNNFFGRPIWNIDETKNHKIVNNYVQSTAVDIALSYFSELCETLNLDLCKPIFIIHDALVLDVHNDYKLELVNIAKKGYNCSELGYFPIKLENLSETY